MADIQLKPAIFASQIDILVKFGAKFADLLDMAVFIASVDFFALFVYNFIVAFFVSGARW